MSDLILLLLVLVSRGLIAVMGVMGFVVAYMELQQGWEKHDFNGLLKSIGIAVVSLVLLWNLAFQIWPGAFVPGSAQ